MLRRVTSWKFTNICEVLAACINRAIVAVHTSLETSVNFYKTTRLKNPEYNSLYARRRENLKSDL
jgi:hypothetical protein